EERARADEQAQAAAEPRVDASEQEAAGRGGEMAADRSEAVEEGAATAPVGLALDRAPEQVEDLGHDDHARDPVGLERREEDARIAAADVKDVRADAQRVDQADRLLEQVAEREDAYHPVGQRRGTRS